MSSASIRTSSSELVLDDSDIIFTLPKELETVIRSAFAMVDHKELEFMLLDSTAPAKCEPFFLLGMFMAARPVMVGDESGENCSGAAL